MLCSNEWQLLWCPQLENFNCKHSNLPFPVYCEYSSTGAILSKFRQTFAVVSFSLLKKYHQRWRWHRAIDCLHCWHCWHCWPCWHGLHCWCCWYCWHCWHCWNCFTLLKHLHACLYILLGKFRTLLEWDNEEVSKRLFGVRGALFAWHAPIVS